MVIGIIVGRWEERKGRGGHKGKARGKNEKRKKEEKNPP